MITYIGHYARKNANIPYYTPDPGTDDGIYIIVDADDYILAIDTLAYSYDTVTRGPEGIYIATGTFGLDCILVRTQIKEIIEEALKPLT